MAKSCSGEDSARAVKLWNKWVTSGYKVDFARLKAAVQSETRAAEKGILEVSPDMLRELRAERSEIGKLAKRCATYFTHDESLDGARRKRRKRR